MQITGRHRIPAEPSRVWEAMADPATLARCLPPGVVMDRTETGARVRLPAARFDAILAPDGADAPRSVRLRLAPSRAADADGAGAAAADGTFGLTLAADGAFTVVDWRLDTPDGAGADAIADAIDDGLARLGQHAAVPTSVATDGISGALTAGIESLDTAAAARSPVGPLLARVAAWPREVAIGGALFAVVALIVVGIL